MQPITDAHGQTWQLRLNIAAADRARRAGFNLFTCYEVGEHNAPPLAAQIIYDPTIALRICAACLEPQLSARHISAEDFLERFDGPTSIEAVKALREELADFFHASGREYLAMILAEAAREAEDMPRKVQQILAGLSAASGSSPESADSTPESSPSPSSTTPPPPDSGTTGT